jgi:LysR family transcriptional regulator, nod-box dependent transcriptional activator
MGVSGAMEASPALRRLDMNLLLPLKALLETRHVTRAAEQVGIGQPAMSAALARLRRVFGDPLLVRSGRGMELTPKAYALIDPVDAAIASLEQMLSVRPTFDPRSDERTFTVVATDYVIFMLIRPLLSEFYREAPRIVIRAVPWTVTTPLALERSQVDLVILPREVATPGMAHFPQMTLWHDHYVPAVWRHNTEVGEVLDIAAMERLPYIRFSQPDLEEYVDVQLEAHGVRTNVALSTPNFTLVPTMLLETPCYGFVHQRLFRALPYRRDLRTLKCPINLNPIVEVMFWNQVFQNDPAHQWLRHRISTFAATL